MYLPFYVLHDFFAIYSVIKGLLHGLFTALVILYGNPDVRGVFFVNMKK
jgi:hypothetical protein